MVSVCIFMTIVITDIISCLYSCWSYLGLFYIQNFACHSPWNFSIVIGKEQLLSFGFVLLTYLHFTKILHIFGQNFRS